MTNKLLTKNDFRFLDDRFEDDMYASTDDRTWKSNVYDIHNGDNFEDFCKDYFELLDEEDYWS